MYFTLKTFQFSILYDGLSVMYYILSTLLALCLTLYIPRNFKIKSLKLKDYKIRDFLVINYNIFFKDNTCAKSYACCNNCLASNTVHYYSHIYFCYP